MLTKVWNCGINIVEKNPTNTSKTPHYLGNYEKNKFCITKNNSFVRTYRRFIRGYFKRQRLFRAV